MFVIAPSTIWLLYFSVNIQQGVSGCECDMRIYALQSLLRHSDPATCTFVRKFFQFAVFLNRQTAVPIFGQLRLPIISSFASHAVLPLLRFVEEHTTLSDSNPDGAGWALTCQTANYRWSFEFNFSQSAEEAEFLDIENHSGSHSTFFHVRFCQATFVTFFQFSYIRSIIPLTHVTIGVVCCQNQNLVEYSVFVLQKTFSCISHRQRVSHRSQPSIDRERSRHSPIICHMRKTCEFEVSVLRCRMQSATRNFVELPLCSKISSRSP